jgi:hypothetical protein
MAGKKKVYSGVYVRRVAVSFIPNERHTPWTALQNHGSEARQDGRGDCTGEKLPLRLLARE